MADDRQTKLDSTISSVAPARLQATRQAVEAERKKTPMNLPSMDQEPASETTERLKQLDLIQDVQLILIDKYQRGTKLMMGAVVLMLVSLAGLGRLIWKNNELFSQIEALQAEQQKLIDRGAQIEKKTDETKQTIDETKQTIDATKEKVDQAVEEAPKIEIDEAGKAKVVVPVRKFRPKAKKGMGPPAPPTSASPTPSAATLPMQIPLETKGF